MKKLFTIVLIAVIGYAGFFIASNYYEDDYSNVIVNKNDNVSDTTDVELAKINKSNAILPNTYVDTIYFNISLSTNEVVSELEKLEFDSSGAYYLFIDNDYDYANCVMLAIKEENNYFIAGMYESSIIPIFSTNADITNEEFGISFTGWGDILFNTIQHSIFEYVENKYVSLKVDSIAYSDGGSMTTGDDNDKIINLFAKSSTFKDETIEIDLNNEYSGTDIIIDDTTSIDLLEMLENGEMPLTIEYLRQYGYVPIQFAPIQHYGCSVDLSNATFNNPDGIDLYYFTTYGEYINGTLSMDLDKTIYKVFDDLYPNFHFMNTDDDTTESPNGIVETVFETDDFFDFDFYFVKLEDLQGKTLPYLSDVVITPLDGASLSMFTYNTYQEIISFGDFITYRNEVGEMLTITESYTINNLQLDVDGYSYLMN